MRLQLSALLVVVAAAASAVWIGTRPETTIAGCDIPFHLPPGNATSALNAPGGGGLRVTEKGFTQTRNEVLVGAMVENTSSTVAYRTQITLRILDFEGKPAEAPNSGQLQQEIPVILPGQSVGVGSFAYAGDRPLPVAGTQVATVKSVDILLGETQWLPQETLGRGYGDATGKYAQHLGNSSFTYMITVSHCRMLDSAQVLALYRDKNGAIVGGTRQGTSRGRFLCQPGTHSDNHGGYGNLPPNVDPARTEFYPYCALTVSS